MDYERVNLAEKGMANNRRLLGAVKVDDYGNEMLRDVVENGSNRYDDEYRNEEDEEKMLLANKIKELENQLSKEKTESNKENKNNNNTINVDNNTIISDKETKLMEALGEYRKKVLISELKSGYQAFCLFKSLSKTLNKEQLGEVIKNYFEDLTSDKNNDIMSL